MANNVVSFDKMQVGKKGGGKHWTKKEVEGRRKAAQKITRKGKTKLQPPQYIKDDLDAFRIWQKIIRDLKGIELLDNLDAYSLATYCKLEAEKERAVSSGDINMFEKLSKTALSYAKDLGLTARSRASLARQRAAEEVDPNADLFD